LPSSKSIGLTGYCQSISQNHRSWSYFVFTGAPYRAYLFRVGRRTQYWVIYTVDEDTRTVDVLHFWNASRDPESLDMSG